MANKITLSWRADLALAKALKKAAAEKGVGHSTMVRMIVKAWFDAKRES